MVNIFTYRRQHAIRSASYLPEMSRISFSLADTDSKQINNANFSMELDEKLALLQSILATTQPSKMTIYNEQQEQEELVATDVVIPSNLPVTITEITNNPFQPRYQHYSAIADIDKKSYPINHLSMEKYSIVSNSIENQQIKAKIKPTIVAKQQHNNRLAQTAGKSVTKPLLSNDGTHLKSISCKMVKESDLSLIIHPTVASIQNSMGSSEQKNHLIITDGNHLPNNDTAYPFAVCPPIQATNSSASNLTAEIPAKTATTYATSTDTPPEAELRYTFTQWQGNHYVDICRITDHHLQLMTSNSHVMSILQRHLNERASPLSVSLSDTRNITLNEVLDNSDESGDE